MLFIR